MKKSKKNERRGGSNKIIRNGELKYRGKRLKKKKKKKITTLDLVRNVVVTDNKKFFFSLRLGRGSCTTIIMRFDEIEN